jgi:chemotaxis protein MotB
MPGDSIIIKKKKVAGHGGHHGGSWKVAYADFVTAMMAFFMVLWIMGLSDDTKLEIQGYFQDPAGFMKNPPRTKTVISLPGTTRTTQQKQRGAQTSEYGDKVGIGLGGDEAKEGFNFEKDFKKELENSLDLKSLSSHIEISLTKEGIQIELLEDKGGVFFESGSKVISERGKKLIKGITPLLKSTGRYIVIEGHTDKKSYAGTDYTNWELSTERAIAFRRALGGFGIPMDRFREVRGFADQKLKVPSKPFAPANRRVTLLLPWGKKAVKEPGSKAAKDQVKGELGPSPLPEIDIRTKSEKPQLRL